MKAAKDLPFLTDEEVEREALRFGLIDTVQRVHHNHADPEAQKGEMRQRTSTGKDSEKAYDEQNRSGNDSEVVVGTPNKSE